MVSHSKPKVEIKSEEEDDENSDRSKNGDSIKNEENVSRKKSKPMTEEKQKMLHTEKVFIIDAFSLSFDERRIFLF